ncbi:hypothetical protein E2C01_070979 [Portunus trituberculatus]|uniref:Uncharacterized protein n=1 Tax=Portunus trituberculatus TaxID=210409 RepID=A0A5B7I2T5_PORTR|nr:hypothetical protein [Portunus trituberculatus]
MAVLCPLSINQSIKLHLKTHWMTDWAFMFNLILHKEASPVAIENTQYNKTFRLPPSSPSFLLAPEICSLPSLASASLNLCININTQIFATCSSIPVSQRLLDQRFSAGIPG